MAGLCIGLVLATGITWLVRTNPEQSPTKYVAVYVTDFPGGLERLRVNIVAATVGAQGAPLRVEQAVVELSLLHGPGDSLRIASGNVPPEAAGRVSIIFGGAEGFRDESWFPLEVPQNRLTVENALVQGSFDRNAVLFDFNLNTSLVVQTGAEVFFQPYVQTAYEYHFENYTDFRAGPTDATASSDGASAADSGLNWSRALELAPVVRMDLPPQFIDSLAKEIVQGLCERMPGCIDPTGVLKECLAELTCPIPLASNAPCRRGTCTSGLETSCDSPQGCSPGSNGSARNRPPNTPSAPNPFVGQEKVSLDPVLSWSGGDPDGGITLYNVIAEGGGQCLNTASTHCEIRGLAPGRTYSWSVTATDGLAQTHAGPWAFTTRAQHEAAPANRPPNPPSSPYPESGSSGRPVTLAVQWSGGDPDAEVLQYRVFLDASMDPTTVACDWQSPTTCSLSPLATSGTYRWKVVARDSHGAQTPGPLWSFSTASSQSNNNPPDLPGAPSPGSGSSGVSLNPVLSWSGQDPDNDPVLYDVIMDDHVVCAATPARTCPVSNLSPGTSYSWSVTASDVPESTPSITRVGPTWTFRTVAVDTPAMNRAPGVAQDPTPADAAIGIPTESAQLVWSGSDPDGDALTFQVLSGFDAQALTVWCAWSSQTACSISGLTPGATYYWRVESRDSSPSVVQGPLWSFKANRAPNPPAQPDPTDGEVSVSTTGRTLAWAGSDPDGHSLDYQVLLGTTSPPDVIKCGWSSSTNCPTSTLSSATTYYWRVDARDVDGLIANGPVWSFSTAGSGGGTTAIPTPTTPSHPTTTNLAQCQPPVCLR